MFDYKVTKLDPKTGEVLTQEPYTCHVQDGIRKLCRGGKWFWEDGSPILEPGEIPKQKPAPLQAPSKK